MPWPTTSSTARGYGAAWQRLRGVILGRDGGLCQVCAREGKVTLATQVDHIKPKAKGGSDDPDNLQAICVPCHEAKTAADEGRTIRRQVGLDGWPVER